MAKKTTAPAAPAAAAGKVIGSDPKQRAVVIDGTTVSKPETGFVKKCKDAKEAAAVAAYQLESTQNHADNG